MKTRLNKTACALILSIVLVAAVRSTSLAQTFGGVGTGPIPDGAAGPQVPGAPLDVTFAVAGLTGNLSDLVISMTFGPASPTMHTWAGDVVATLISPGGAFSLVIFGNTGATTGTSFGDSSNLTGPYTFSDGAVGGWWAAALAAASTAPIPVGSYRTSTIGGPGGTGATTSINAVFGGLTPLQANGIWTLRFTDGGAGDTGSVTAASLTFTQVPEPATTALLVVAAGALGLGAWRKRKAG